VQLQRAWATSQKEEVMETMTERMLSTHPQRPTPHFDAVAACLAACRDCEETCTICADACLGEQDVAHLRQCIRLCLDCADVCAATERIVARQAAPDAQLWTLALEACARACRVCADECRAHEGRHAHCRICREACESCERACRNVLAAYPGGGAARGAH
jgi:hypothetical protein